MKISGKSSYKLILINYYKILITTSDIFDSSIDKLSMATAKSESSDPVSSAVVSSTGWLQHCRSLEREHNMEDTPDIKHTTVTSVVRLAPSFP